MDFHFRDSGWVFIKSISPCCLEMSELVSNLISKEQKLQKMLQNYHKQADEIEEKCLNNVDQFNNFMEQQEHLKEVREKKWKIISDFFGEFLSWKNSLIWKNEMVLLFLKQCHFADMSFCFESHRPRCMFLFTSEVHFTSILFNRFLIAF